MTREVSVLPCSNVYQVGNNLVVSADCKQLGWLAFNIRAYDDSGPQPALASLCTPRTPRTRGISAVAVGPRFHGSSRSCPDGFAMGAHGRHFLLSACDPNRSACAVGSFRSLCSWKEARSQRAEERSSGPSGARWGRPV